MLKSGDKIEKEAQHSLSEKARLMAAAVQQAREVLVVLKLIGEIARYAPDIILSDPAGFGELFHKAVRSNEEAHQLRNRANEMIEAPMETDAEALAEELADFKGSPYARPGK